jgi:glycosyltransferase involved in cell wall biosynthesis
MICVVIAAYNEAQSLTTLLPAIPERLAGHPVTVIVGSDGSTDATAAVAREHGCIVVESLVNRGKGANLRACLDRAAELDYDVIVFLDADGQHDPNDLGRMVDPVLNADVDLVAGSRYTGERGRGTAPWNRYLVRCATTELLARLLGRRFTDPYCGYRALSPHAVETIELKGDRYQSELEMLFGTVEHRLTVEEVAIHKVYGPNTSKMGARRGAFFGRIEVIGQYTGAIVAGARNLRKSERAGRSSRVAG